MITKKHVKYCLTALFAAILALAVWASSVSGSFLALADEDTSSTTAKFYSDYDSVSELKSAAEELTEELVSEGAILMKNDSTLPLKGTEKVSVFGVTADNLIGASDSSGAFSSGDTASDETVGDALDAAGFKVNPTLKNFYLNDTSEIGEETLDFTGKAEASLDVYNDAAVVVFSREGGEGEDASTTTTPSGEQETTEEEHAALLDGNRKHSLMLTDSEEELIDYVTEKFDTVIVLLNTSNAMEVAQLQNNDNINAIVDISRPGVGGLAGVAGILNGTYNPSGHLVDEWMTDFTADPTWYNFGDNSQTGSSTTYCYSDGTVANSSVSNGVSKSGMYGVDYEESIYLGYKYYETYYQDIYTGAQDAPDAYSSLSNEEAATAWYEDAVTYPFGYGMSYTTFSMNAGGLYSNESCTEELSGTIDADTFSSSVGSPADVDKLYIPVTVKNTGDVAGKEVAQVYVSAPYTSGGIEKAAVTLVGYAKTDVLEPGEEETIVVSFNVQDMASWDYTDANDDGYKGDYELDEGDYTLYVMESSHYDLSTDDSDTTDASDAITFTLSGTAHQQLDDYSGNELSNLFSEENGTYGDELASVNEYYYNADRTAAMMADGESGMTHMSRSSFEGTFPEEPTTGDLYFKDDVIDNWLYQDEFNVDNYEEYADDENDPWYKTSDDIPDTWDQADEAYAEGEAPIQYTEMAGVDWDDDQWDTFLNQLTYEELQDVVEYGGYGTVNLDGVGKAQTVDADGPNNLSSSHCWCSEDLIASTWNVELAAEQGRMVGNFALVLSTSGWYGPGMDTHRTPFSGRNNEYYSQDGLQGGYIAAAVVKAAQSKGVICYVKHCFLNDQETNRDGKVLSVWTNEQNIRENYAKVFQMALQEGGSKAAMTGYARIGGIPNTGNYNLMTGLMQEQWGSKAYFVTDGYIGWMDATELDIMVRTGYQLQLYTSPYVEELSGSWDSENDCVILADGSESATQWYSVRMSAKAVLYGGADTTTQMNGYSLLSVDSTTISCGTTELTATQNLSFSADLSLADGVLTDGSFVDYSITDGSLPDGIELDEVTGELSGETSETGTYTFTVEYLIDGYVEKSATFTLTVDAAFGIADGSDDLTALVVGEDFLAQLTSSVYTTASYDTVSYALADGSSLPDGLELDSLTGLISGTPTTAGTYDVTIVLTASSTSEDTGSGSSTETVTAEATFTFIVTGEAAEEDDETAALIEALQESVSDLEEQIADLEAEVEALASASSDTSDDSSDTDSGCGSVISATGIAATVSVIAVCAAAVIVCGRKSRKE